MPAAARILVVDDDVRISATVRRMLEAEGHDVDMAANGDAALRAVRNRLPDLVVLDVMLPGIDGVAVCRRLRASASDLPILMLTARAETRDRVLGLDSGADDYLVKPFAYDELLARVRALLRRSPARRVRLSFADLVLDLDGREVWRGERLLQLTPTELELLLHFMRHPRQVLTREQLIDTIWRGEPENDNIVAVYVGYLRQKLEAGGRPRVIHTVRGTGYVLREG